MKTIKLAVLFAVLIASIGQSIAQTNLQFTGVNVTDEGAIQLHWTSTNDELYQIQYANALATNADGTTAWQVLYDNYPSQGTNTFIGDFGNYSFAPEVVHPQSSPMRFYRILDEGQDSLAPDEPTVSITSPTSEAAATGELNIAVVASSDQPVISGTRLYVDGQEMLMANSTTNWTDGSTNYEMDTYSINTSEWGNETHTLFATAECASGYADLVNAAPVLTGHAVSPFVPVLFSNLITRISFSQPSFDPSSGETQQVSAVFAANCDWTLNIVDIDSNVVQTASGSGTSMLYNWDGTSNGTNLLNGIYYYYIYAQTNGESSDAMVSGGSFSSSAMTASSSANSDSSELWAMSADGDDAVPLALYPPGFNTNDLTIFSASPAEINAARTSVSRASFSPMDSGGSFSPDASGGGSSAGSQGSAASPQRPPNNPVRGLVGTFSVAYDTYTANGTNPISAPLLLDGSGAGTHIQFQNFSGTAHLGFGPLTYYKTEAKDFISNMKHWGWNNALTKADDQLNINDLRGSGSPFNTNTLALILLHGTYGTSPDYAANQCKQMYFPITSGGSINWLRMSEMTLGGTSATNGLKWIAIHACHSLYHTDWSNMKNAGVKPYNNNLHLILGCDTDSFTGTVPWYWAEYMNYGTSTNSGSANPLTLRAAWYQGGQQAFQNTHLSENVTFAVAGDSACMNDSLQTNSAPGGSWSYDSQQIYTMH